MTKTVLLSFLLIIAVLIGFYFLPEHMEYTQESGQPVEKIDVPDTKNDYNYHPTPCLEEVNGEVIYVECKG